MKIPVTLIQWLQNFPSHRSLSLSSHTYLYEVGHMTRCALTVLSLVCRWEMLSLSKVPTRSWWLSPPQRQRITSSRSMTSPSFKVSRGRCRTKSSPLKVTDSGGVNKSRLKEDPSLSIIYGPMRVPSTQELIIEVVHSRKKIQRI